VDFKKAKRRSIVDIDLRLSNDTIFEIV